MDQFVPFSLLGIAAFWAKPWFSCTWAAQILAGNCFLPYHCTRFYGKDETVFKKISKICVLDFFPERNFILWIFLSGMGFLFLFLDFHFRNRIISFWIFFFLECIIFNSGFFCPK